MLISKPFLQYSQILNALKCSMQILIDWYAIKKGFEKQSPREPSRGRTTKKSKRRRSRSTSSSLSDNDSLNLTRTSRSRSRSKSPQIPKMPVFKDSDSPNLESFIYQFERVAAQKGWSANKKAFRLLDCLGEVALEHA